MELLSGCKDLSQWGGLAQGRTIRALGLAGLQLPAVCFNLFYLSVVQRAALYP